VPWVTLHSHTLIMISAYIFTLNVTLYLFSALIWWTFQKLIILDLRILQFCGLIFYLPALLLQSFPSNQFSAHPLRSNSILNVNEDVAYLCLVEFSLMVSVTTLFSLMYFKWYITQFSADRLCKNNIMNAIWLTFLNFSCSFYFISYFFYLNLTDFSKAKHPMTWYDSLDVLIFNVMFLFMCCLCTFVLCLLMKAFVLTQLKLICVHTKTAWQMQGHSLLYYTS
jgi:hypothetical protein